MEVKAGYKQTEVGVIPEDWEIQDLGKIGHLSTGSGLLKGEFSSSGEIPAIPYTSLYTDFSEIVDYESINWFVDDINKSTLVDFPCVLIASSSNMEINTGKACALMKSIPVAIGREVIIFKTSSNCAFISYLLSTEAYRKRTLTLARGTTIKHVYTATFRDYPVAYPTKAEQEAIAEALSDADALIESLEQLIAKKRQIKQGAMQELLTGKKRLPGFSGEWEETTLGSLGVFAKGSGVRKHEANSGNLPCVRYGEIYTLHNDYVKTYSSYISAEVALTAKQLRRGDLLFAGSGETREEIGKCIAFLDDIEAYAGGDIVILRPEGVDSLFFGYFLNTPEVVDQKASKGQGDAVVHISARALASIAITIPEMTEQTAIAGILSDMDTEIAALETKLTKARQIKQGMMQELLTGKTRLI